MEIHGTLTFTRESQHTRLRWCWRLRPRGLLRFLGPLVRAVGKRQERANWIGLKHYLEATDDTSRPKPR